MNKRILIFLFIFSGIVTVNAQVSFRAGFRGGANFSHFTEGEFYDYYASPNDYDNSQDFQDNYSSVTSFYAGLYGTLKFNKLYSLQPEINYSSQGSDYRSFAFSKNFKVDYLSFQVINKFTFVDRFFLLAGPTLDFVVDRNFDIDSEVDMAFVLGVGVNLTRNFGIELRAKKGIIPVIDFGDNYHTNVVFSVGGTYTFDVK